MTKTLLLVVASAAVLDAAPVNSGVRFVIDRYYFEMSYGQAMEFYEEKYLPGSGIWHLHFKSILRIELPATGDAYRGFTVPPDARTSRVTWNPSKTRVLAASGEHALILSPQLHLLKAYRNTSAARWLNDDEIFAVVGEFRNPAEYALNVQTDRFRLLKSSQP